VPKNAPDMPPNAAPIAYASSFVFTSGMPIDTAATLVLTQRDPGPAQP